MQSFATKLHLISAGLALAVLSVGVVAGEAKVDFRTQIQPIFAAHCYGCHGPEGQEGGLRLDARAATLQGGDSGPAVVAGDSGQSRLMARITSEDEDLRMPPPWEDTVKPLAADQIALVKRWVDEGLAWPEDPDGEARVKSDHWSFQPVSRQDPPPVANSAWVKSPIDGFVLARLEALRIEPSPEADRYTLIRRLYYDLLGLPPAPEDVDMFMADESSDAYGQLVDRLLQSPHFGERWGRHWLDKARYADSDGYEKDRPRPNAWRYRDWVIDAINRDMPLDQFTIQQLAGDLLPDAAPIQRLATAFNRQTLTNTEGGVDQEEFRVAAVKDRVNTLGSVWLGLTIGCADCHSHKYDPITQREYYQLFAFFNNGDEANMEVTISDEAVAEYEREKAEHGRRLEELDAKLHDYRKQLADGLAEWEARIQDELAEEQPQSVQFHPLDIASIQSEQGATLEPLGDGSYLAQGKNPAKDQYVLLARSDLDGITGFRIEAPAHESLGGRGPGRTGHGNFVLSEFQAYAGPSDDFGEGTSVQFSAAQADFSQSGWPVAAAIDGKDETGWAVSPQMGKDHEAVFVSQAPVGAERSKNLKLVLRFLYGSQHVLGRFRILARTGSKPGEGVPGDVLTILKVKPEERNDRQNQALLDYYLSQDPTGRKLQKDVDEWKKKTPKRPVMSVRVIAQRKSDSRETHTLARGDFLQPGAAVQPGVLKVLHALEPRHEDGLANRLDLARWLVDPANPLTPRVMVNQIWAHLFGTGLVRTPDDFGVRGRLPTHPMLLDWLAEELVRCGWSRKAMIKRIVTSATYRQMSNYRPELADVDPLNTLLYRQNRVRVEAEIVRDLYLAAGGLLVRNIGGPSVYPPMPADVAALSYANSFKWATSQGDDRYRRGMYTFFKRTAAHPNLTTFDCPDSNTTCVQRRTSNTPLQALTALNNQAFVEASQAMAERVLGEAGCATDAGRTDYAFRLTVARPPSEYEQGQLLGLLAKARRWYGEHRDEATALVGGYQPQGIPTHESAPWVVVARTILNMDEFVTRE